MNQPCNGNYRENSGSGLTRAAEANEKHNDSQHDMEPRNSGIIGYDEECVARAYCKSPNGDDSVNDPEDLKPHSGWARAAHRGEEKDNSGGNMNKIVCSIHHENAEEHVIRSNSRNETENSNSQEDNTQDDRERFNHSDLLWVEEEGSLMTVVLSAGKTKQDQSFTTSGRQRCLRSTYETNPPSWDFLPHFGRDYSSL
jgi:hypothetical protein